MPGYQTGPDNRLVSDGTCTYTYDNEGNTLTKTRVSDGQVTTFSWDYRNRLTEAVVKTSGGVTVDDEKFTYDANDHRIGVWANGAQQSWTVYDGDTPYLDFDGSGSLTTRYLSDPRAIDAFFAREDGAGNVAWLLTDKLGSVREVVGSGGNVLDAITYDSYGNILNETNAANGGDFKFAGMRRDAILSAYYDNAREFDPWAGQFWSEDPSGLGPDSNPRRYGDNNPINETDPTGLQPRPGQPGYEEFQRRFFVGPVGHVHPIYINPTPAQLATRVPKGTPQPPGGWRLGKNVREAFGRFFRNVIDAASDLEAKVSVDPKVKAAVRREGGTLLLQQRVEYEAKGEVAKVIFTYVSQARKRFVNVTVEVKLKGEVVVQSVGTSLSETFRDIHVEEVAGFIYLIIRW